MSTLSRRDFVHAGAAAGVALASTGASAEGAAPTGPANPWLVMVYLAGDNDLTRGHGPRAAGPPRGRPAGGRHDPRAVRPERLRPGGSEVRLRHGRRPANPSRATAIRSFSPSEINTGSKEALLDFVAWADGKCRDEEKANPGQDYQYLLILSGHGSGTTEDFLLKDDSSLDSLTIGELQDALAAANQIIRKGPPRATRQEDRHPGTGCLLHVHGRGRLPDSQGGRHPDRSRGAGAGVRLAVPTAPQEGQGRPYRERRPGDDRLDELARVIVDGVRRALQGLRSERRTLRRPRRAGPRPRRERQGEVRRARSRSSTGLDKADHEKVLLAHWYAQTYKSDQFVDLKDLCAQMAERFDVNSPIGRRRRPSSRAWRGTRRRAERGAS